MNIWELNVGLKVDKNNITNLTNEIKNEMRWATESIDAVGKKASESAKDIETLQVKIKTLGIELKSALKSQDYEKALKIQIDITSAEKSLNALKTANKNAKDEIKKVSDEMKKTEVSAKTFGETMKWVGSAIIAVFAVQKIYEFGAGIITLASNLQQAQVSFTTMLWSAEASGKILKDLSDFAKTTPFELVWIRENAKQLLAMWVAQENIIPTMKALGDVAAGLSVPLDRLALAYGQVLSKWRLQGDELMQFTEAWVPMLQTLAAQLGKTTGDINKMIEKWQISAVEVTKAFQTMSGEGGKFANMMEKQSATIEGKWSNLQDSLNSLGESIGTKFLPKLSEWVEWLLDTVNKYGDSGWMIMIDTVSVLTDIVSSGINGWNELFKVLAENTVNTEKRQVTFWKAVLFVFGLIISWFEMVVFGLKTAWWAIGSVVYVIAQRFGALWGVIGSFASQVWWMMNVVGNNIGVAFMSGVDVAIGGINSLIALVNKIPWVNMSSIWSIWSSWSFQEFVQWKSPLEWFAEKNAAITKEMEWNFSDFTSSVASDFFNLSSKIEMRNDQILQSSKKTSEEIKKIPPINLDKISISWGWSPSWKSSETKQAEELTSEIGKLKDEYTKLKNVQKETDDLAQKNFEANIKRLESSRAELLKIGDQIKKNETDYLASIEKISSESKKKSEEETGSYVRNQAVKQAETEKNIREIDAQIAKEKETARLKWVTIDSESLDKQKNIEQNIAEAKLRQSEFTSKTADSTVLTMKNNIANLEAQLEALKWATDYNENTQKLIDFQTKRNELENILKDTKSNIANLSTEEAGSISKILETERMRSGLSTEKQTEFDYKQKLKAIEDERIATEELAKTKFDADQAQLQRQQMIYEFFQKKISLSPEQLNQIQQSQQFQGASGEEQALILKLANELITITENRNKRLALEKEIADETQKLSDLTTQKQISNVQKLKKEYQDLISEIKNAISAQQSLDASKTTARGFSDGGYTGDGGVGDVAGVVHKGEYVMSQDMLSRLPGIIPTLEGIRGGNTYDQSRSVEISWPISVNESLDFEGLIRRAKFTL